MNPDRLLAEAALGTLSPEAQQALVQALRDHLFNDATLDDALGLRMRGPGPNPRSELLRSFRNDALRDLWDALPGPTAVARAEAAHSLLDRRRDFPDPAADAIESLADAVLQWDPDCSLSADRIARICGW